MIIVEIVVNHILYQDIYIYYQYTHVHVCTCIIIIIIFAIDFELNIRELHTANFNILLNCQHCVLKTYLYTSQRSL